MKSQKNKFRTDQHIIWCPGCGNFGILAALENAFLELGLKPNEIFAVYGIGCHGHMANYLKVYNFEGLHGRALPLATGVKIANKNLKVLAVVGDGDQLGEGGNHLIHASRRNPDIKCILHNNQLYSLTVGQASSTSDLKTKTKSTPEGVFDLPLNPLALAIASGAGFVARGFAGNIPQLTKIFIQALKHKGFALIDVLQPCVSLNYFNTASWYKQRIYELGKDYDPQDKVLAFKRALEWGEKIPIGVFYKEERPTLEDNLLPTKNTILAQEPLKVVLKDILTEFQ